MARRAVCSRAVTVVQSKDGREFGDLFMADVVLRAVDWANCAVSNTRNECHEICDNDLGTATEAELREERLQCGQLHTSLMQELQHLNSIGQAITGINDKIDKVQARIRLLDAQLSSTR